jgi:hypothetical protein
MIRQMSPPFHRRMPLAPVIAMSMAAFALSLSACGGGGGGRAEIADADRDGIADSSDCAPQDAQAWQLLSFAARNDDGDAARVNSAGQVCAGASLPANRFAAAVPANEVDCDDSDANIWTLRSYEAVDEDDDSVGAPGAGTVCAGNVLPAGYLAAAPAPAEADCDDDDDTRWRLHSFMARDQDADGFRVAATGAFCGQDALPSNLFSQSPTTAQLDCDDDDPTRWNWGAVYRDADGDGVGAGTASYQCLGSAGPAPGFARRGYDPNDDPLDPNAVLVAEFDLESWMLTAADDADDDDI